MLYCVFVGGLFSGEAMAQSGPTSEAELQELAQKMFDEGRYSEAMERYSQLLSLHPASPEFNYRFGACLVFADADKEKSFKHLRFAIGKNDVPVEVHYFLGKAYHLNYQFADALIEYNIYHQRTENDRKKKYDVHREIEQCRNGLKLLSNIKDITVLSKVETSADEFFRNYDLSDIGGRVLVCPDELLSKYDKKTGERFLMYFPGNTSIAFFSSYGSDGTNGRDIYRASRLPNGVWSKPVPMTAINTSFHDNFPFLHPDGTTFYFSSEGHNSMGGYDVFRSTYSSSDDSFTAPVNLDFAVNSPDDDMLYITDKNHELAYFASARSSGHGRMHVYRVAVSTNALQLVLIKGKFVSDADYVGQSAEITVTDATSNAFIGQYLTDPATGNYVIDLPRSGRYKFTVDAEGSKLAHNGIVEVPPNDKVVAYSQELTLTVNNAIEKLVIKNNFDKPLDIDLYALAQGVLKNRAGLEVNYDESTAGQTASTTSGDLSQAYLEAGFSTSLSNEKVLENARAEQSKLTDKSENIREQRDYAFTLAQKKQQSAEKAARDAEDQLRLADAVGEESISRKYLMDALASKFAAEKQSEEARVALQLSQQLDERLYEIEREEQIAEALAGDLEAALQTGEKEKVLESFAALKEREVSQRSNPVHEVDESERLRVLVRDAKNEVENDSRKAEELREEERSLALRIKNRELHLDAAKSKDKQDIQRELETLKEDHQDLQNQIQELLTTLEPAQNEAESLAAQADLFNKISNQQTDTYIPSDQLITFNSAAIPEIQSQVENVESETEAMEFNLSVVQNILEEESNVAIEAFSNEADLNAFVEKYELPQPKSATSVERSSPQSKEDVQNEIAAARDWMNIIDESVAELEQERAQLTAGAKRDSIDKKLADFQELKYKKVQEIEQAEEQLTTLETRDAKPYSITAEDDAEDQADIAEQSPEAVPSVEPPASAERLTQTIVQRDPIYDEIDPEYQEKLQVLGEKQMSREQSIRKKNELDREFISKMDERISLLEDIPAAELQEDDARDLELMQLLRKQMAEDIAFSENLLVSEQGGTPKTSTEILMEANGIITEEAAPQVSQPVKTPKTADEIPAAESISYKDIDSGYEAALKKIKDAPIDESEKVAMETELHQALIDQIDEQTETYRQIAEDSPPREQLRIANSISQLQQIRKLKAREVELNEMRLVELKRGSFAAENSIVTQEVDAGYVKKYWEIELSEQEPYAKTLEKAQLEQSVVDQIDERLVELVSEMDAVSTNPEKEEIQETIQELQTVRQEKVIAYESLFALAEQLKEAPEEPAMEPATESVADLDESEEIQTEPEVAVNETDQTADASQEVAPFMTDAAFTEALDGFIQREAGIVGDLDEYTVFGEIDNLEYKSLNASLDMETIAGDLQRHQQRIVDFVSAHGEQPLDAAAQDELKSLMRSELSLQKRVADANRREIDFYEISNSEVLEILTTTPPGGLEEFELRSASEAQNAAIASRDEAIELRTMANATTDPSERLRLQKEAFEKEVAAIQQFSRVNQALTTWRKGNLVAWNDPLISTAQVVHRTESLDDIIAASAVAERNVPTQHTSEPRQVTTPAVFEEIVPEAQSVITGEELYAVEDAELKEALEMHFFLTPEALERIEANPVYLDWFKHQWVADSLEILRTERHTAADNLLLQADQMLIESEAETARAEAETDEALKNEAFDRAAELQKNARDLFEMAQRLRDEMSQYSSQAENARTQADSLLATLSSTQAEELQQIASASITVEERSVAEVAEPQQPEEREVTRTTEPEETPVVRTVPEERSEPVVEPAPERVVATEESPIDALPGIEIAAGVEEVFELTSNAAPYSDENPIPVGVEWPDGLVFAVQVGAFRNPIPQDHFTGFSPLRGDRVGDGITRYSAGLFVQYDRADAAKNSIRQMGYSDAFVVAYLNGQRVPLNRALNEAEAAEIIAAAQTAQQRNADQRTTTPVIENTSSEERPVRTEDELAQTATPTDRTESINEERAAGSETPSAIEIGSPDLLPESSATDYYNDPDAAPAVQVERVRGLFFTVQVGVYSTPVTSAQLADITPLNSERTADGKIRYTSGMFPSVEFAQDHRQLVINNGVADAFITAYYNGERITVARAREILASEGESALANARRVPNPETAPVESEVETAAGTTSPVVLEEIPESEFVDAADFDPEDIRFVVDLGAFGTGMPQNTADAILQIPQAGVSRLELPNGKMHYLSRPTENYEDAEALRQQFIEAGVEYVEVRAMALGFLLDLESARNRKSR